jgi:MFS family permease
MTRGSRVVTILRPLRHGSFALLILAQSASRLGDYIFKVAVAIWTLRLDPSGALLARYFMAVSAGTLVTLVAGAAVSDRLGARRSMLLADAVRVVAVGALAAVAIGGRPVSTAVIVVCGLVVGLGDGAFLPAYGRAFAELVPRDELVAANALKSLSGDSMRVLGAALGGVLVVVLGTGWAIALDAATFAFSLACVLAMWRWRETRAPAGVGWRTAVADLREGLAFVRGSSWLWQSLLVQAVNLVTVFGPLAVTIPLYLTGTLHTSTATFSTVLMLQALCSIAAALALGQVRSISRPGLVLYGCALVMNVLLLCAVVASDVVLAVVVFGLTGAALTVMGISWSTVFQANVPVDLQGRAGSVDFLVSMALEPLSLALIPMFLGSFSLTSVMVTACAVAALAAAYALVNPDLRGLVMVEAAEVSKGTA